MMWGTIMFFYRGVSEEPRAQRIMAKVAGVYTFFTIVSVCVPARNRFFFQ
jgi:hypothetical protein